MSNKRGGKTESRGTRKTVIVYLILSTLHKDIHVRWLGFCDNRTGYLGCHSHKGKQKIVSADDQRFVSA